MGLRRHCYYLDWVVCHLMIVTIDKAGRIGIHKEIRDALRLDAGDRLTLESEGGRLTLRPLRAGSPLQKERGVWVFYGGKPLSLDEANRSSVMPAHSATCLSRSPGLDACACCGF